MEVQCSCTDAESAYFHYLGLLPSSLLRALCTVQWSTRKIPCRFTYQALIHKWKNCAGALDISPIIRFIRQLRILLYRPTLLHPPTYFSFLHLESYWFSHPLTRSPQTVALQTFPLCGQSKSCVSLSFSLSPSTSLFFFLLTDASFRRQPKQVDKRHTLGAFLCVYVFSWLRQFVHNFTLIITC